MGSQRRTEVSAYVARFVYPDNLAAIDGMFERSGMTDFDLMETNDDFTWSMPKSVLTGDIVFFQLGLKSPANLRKAIREADTLGRDDDIVQHLRRSVTDVEECSGSLIAFGRVAGRAVAGTGGVDAHFKGRVFAPIEMLTPFEHPVPVTGTSPLTRFSAFAAAGPVTHRMFTSDESYQATIAYIGKLTGRSPVLDHTYVGTPVDSTMPGAWAERIARSKAGWFSEDHLRLGFAGPLAREISESRTIDEEVPIINAVGIRTGQVDYTVRIGGQIVPLEAKLSHAAEPNFLTQIAKYTGPASARGVRYDHGVVLAVDSHGVYVLEDGDWAGPKAGEPIIPRDKLSVAAIRHLRTTISARLP